MSDFDYRSMLARYIGIVVDYEGKDYFDIGLGFVFSEEEAEELRRLELEGALWLGAMKR